MNIVCPYDRDSVRQRLNALLDAPGHPGFSGKVSEYQLLLRIRPRRFSLPWSPALRAAMLPIEGGLMLVGKFDSDWALYFVGYPVLAAVTMNVVLNLLGPNAAAISASLLMFLVAALSLCGALAYLYRHKRRLLLQAICDVLEARVVDDKD